jgi:hypothetical protein
LRSRDHMRPWPLRRPKKAGPFQRRAGDLPGHVGEAAVERAPVLKAIGQHHHHMLRSAPPLDVRRETSEPPEDGRGPLAAGQRFVVPRWWSRRDSNCRSSLLFLALAKGSKSQPGHCAEADQRIVLGAICWEILAKKKRPDFGPYQGGKGQRGPAVRIPFAPPTRHCEPAQMRIRMEGMVRPRDADRTRSHPWIWPLRTSLPGIAAVGSPS